MTALKPWPEVRFVTFLYPRSRTRSQMPSIDDELKALQLEKAKLELERLQTRRRLEQRLLGAPACAARVLMSASAWPFLFVLRHLKDILTWAFLALVLGAAGIGLYSWWENERKVAKQRAIDQLEEEVAAACRDELTAAKRFQYCFNYDYAPQRHECMQVEDKARNCVTNARAAAEKRLGLTSK